jgi:hypothetical protein
LQQKQAKIEENRISAGTMRLKMGSAPTPGAADNALVVGFGIGTSPPVSSSFHERFGARARRTTAGAAVLPIKPAASREMELNKQDGWGVEG